MMGRCLGGLRMLALIEILIVALMLTADAVSISPDRA